MAIAIDCQENGIGYRLAQPTYACTTCLVGGVIRLIRNNTCDCGSARAG
ncbi:hypothetical protein [Roseinatronobacter alkalisoli]|uniref:Uncharacterized protein n=1 Tax=Roseinatronobacter alkalisoli TaxID=3028235 RepID=A0ABT5TEW5_9RHOB|nr:hypothetical protein [Roseinatronobacter sp. HJB301]MDD7973489.1 hypothetical protein [Roseinatronobacter sp. HJB301]